MSSHSVDHFSLFLNVVNIISCHDCILYIIYILLNLLLFIVLAHTKRSLIVLFIKHQKYHPHMESVLHVNK